MLDGATPLAARTASSSVKKLEGRSTGIGWLRDCAIASCGGAINAQAAAASPAANKIFIVG
jgi:hypothetical protein